MEEKEFKNSNLSAEIVEKILPKYFTFATHITERMEDGSVQKLYSPIAEKLYWDIYEVLNKEK